MVNKKSYQSILMGNPLLMDIANRTAIKIDSLQNKAINNPKEELLKEVTCYMTAPMLLQFVTWVICEASIQHVKTLYFLARDGYFMYSYAEAICQQYKIPITCKYLYGSRYAWRIPQFHLDIEKAMDFICLGGKDVSFSQVLMRAGCTLEEQEEISQELKIPLEKICSYKEIQNLRDPLQESQLFIPYMIKHSKDAYENCIQYFRQVGLFGTESIALVDSGWTGSLQNTVIHLLESQKIDNSKIQGYYFGLYHTPLGKENTYHSYFFSNKKGFLEKLAFNNCLFEAIYSAPHQMTIGYEDFYGMITPILAESECENIKFMKQQELLFQHFLEETLKVKAFSALSLCIDKKLTKQLCKRLMVSPTREEVNLYGNLQFLDDVIGKKKYLLAENLMRKDLVNLKFFHRIQVLLGHKKRNGKESVWLEGSLARLPKKLQYKYRKHVLLYKCLLYIKKGLQG